MREDNKRWLLGMMKTSGSKRQHIANGRYADDRHLQKNASLEDLPARESIKSTSKFYNGKVNYGLLVRFLRGQIGNNWDDVYSEIISRIPTKLLDYKEMIFWFVADKVEIRQGRIWNKKTQHFIKTNEEDETDIHFNNRQEALELKEFYVDPNSNKLVQIILKK